MTAWIEGLKQEGHGPSDLNFVIYNIRESLLCDNRLLESVGVVCNDDNVAECAGDLCKLVGERISDPEEPPTAETLVQQTNLSPVYRAL